MRIVLAPELPVSWAPRQFGHVRFDEWIAVDIPEDHLGLPLRSLVKNVIQDHPASLAPLDRPPDAPPFTAESWWLATAGITSESVTILSIGPTDFFGIDGDGRAVIDPWLNRLTAADFNRALTNGHYPGANSALVVTSPGEFGGNGALAIPLVQWIVQTVPEVLLAMGVQAAYEWKQAQRDQRVKDLAESWTRQGVSSPWLLRRWVETKRQWYPTVLAERLALSEAAAQSLLTALGYEPGQYDAMELKSTLGALRARDKWIGSEISDYHVSVQEDWEDYAGPKRSNTRSWRLWRRRGEP